MVRNWLVLSLTGSVSVSPNAEGDCPTSECDLSRLKPGRLDLRADSIASLVTCGSNFVVSNFCERKLDAGTYWAKGWASASDCKNLDRHCPSAAAG